MKTRRCACGREYSACEFLALPAPRTMKAETLGVFVMRFDDGGPAEVQVWRDCVCGSTMVEVSE